VKAKGWDLQLAHYIEEVRSRPFEWGTHDCINFANNACIVQRGTGFVGNFLTEYNSSKAALLKYHHWMKETGYKDIIAAVDDRLTRLITKYPPRGAIVAMPSSDNEVLPYSFGVSVNQYCVFVGYEGLLFNKPKDGFLYWGVE
jgi:hypothetical protein